VGGKGSLHAPPEAGLSGNARLVRRSLRLGWVAAAKPQASSQREIFYKKKIKFFIEVLVRSPCHKRYFGNGYLYSFMARRPRLLYAELEKTKLALGKIFGAVKNFAKRLQP